MSEFSIIDELFTPLTEGCAGALGLGDDVALIAQGRCVVSKDMLIAGVHFRKDDPLDLVAQKVMRVNISDLIAKGVKPEGYFLGCAWPQKSEYADIATFVEGLQKDQSQFKCRLYGGDTTRHRVASAPLVISATFFGDPPAAGIVSRGGAQSGDDVYVTGTIGDSGLGLMALSGKLKLSPEQTSYVISRYHLPQPRMTFGTALHNFATASMDISDGLVADTHHLAKQSGVQIILDGERMPLSQAARDWLINQPRKNDGLVKLASFGDDYEILFTAPVSMRRAIEMAAKASRTDVSRVGTVRRGVGTVLIGEGGDPLPVDQNGFDHFSTA